MQTAPDISQDVIASVMGSEYDFDLGELWFQPQGWASYGFIASDGCRRVLLKLLEQEMLLPDVTEWSADKVEAILTDVSLWEKPVRAIAEQEGIHIENIVPGYPASSAAFILNRKHVVKIFAPSFHRKREVESEVLKSLASIFILYCQDQVKTYVIS